VGPSDVPEQVPDKIDVFISYSRHDLALACRVHRSLERAGLRVWRDTSHIAPGAKIRAEIQEALSASGTLLVLMSRNALASEWVKEEVEVFLNSRKKDRSRVFLPVFLPHVADADVPPHWQLHQGVDFRGADLTDPLTLAEKMECLLRALTKQAPIGELDVCVPFVVLAMTHDEFASLWSEQLFQDNPGKWAEKRNYLAQLKAALTEHDLVDLSKHYGAEREDWRPISCAGSSASEIISDTMKRFNAASPERLLHPLFLSSDFLCDDRACREAVWDRLHATGCVLVVDAISLAHPVLCDRFDKSSIGGSNRLFIIGISPLGRSALPVNQLLLDLAGETTVMPFRRYDQLDFASEFGAAESRDVKRWLLRILPEVSSGILRESPDPIRADQFRQAAGVPKLGIHKTFLGKP